MSGFSISTPIPSVNLHRLFRSSWFRWVAFGLWAGLLWTLSSRTGDLQDLPDIPWSDKIAHFIYFAAGGFLLTAACVGSGSDPRWPRLILRITLLMALIGALDEYHQSFVPGRSGNDPYDWMADVLGGLSGVLVFRRIRAVLRPPVDDSYRP